MFIQERIQMQPKQLILTFIILTLFISACGNGREQAVPACNSFSNTATTIMEITQANQELFAMQEAGIANEVELVEQQLILAEVYRSAAEEVVSLETNEYRVPVGRLQTEAKTLLIANTAESRADFLEALVNTIEDCDFWIEDEIGYDLHFNRS